MARWTPPETRPGDLLDAREYNAVKAELVRLGNVSVSGATSSSSRGGRRITVPNGPVRIRARITSNQGDGKYRFARQRRRSPTDDDPSIYEDDVPGYEGDCYERNMSRAVTAGTIVTLEYSERTRDWDFDGPELGFFAMSPSGGMTAGTGTAPSHADGVHVYRFNGTVYVDTADTITLYNSAGAIGGSKMLQGKVHQGGWPLADVEACASS